MSTQNKLANQRIADAASCECSAKPTTYSLLQEPSSLPSQWMAMQWAPLTVTPSIDERYRRTSVFPTAASFANGDLCVRLCRMTV